MRFSEFLKSELEKPINNDQYNPNGNSDRAIVSRGLNAEQIRHYKKYPKDWAYLIRAFDGWETPIAWPLAVVLYTALAPILPIVSARYSYSRAISKYKKSYKEKCNNEEE